MLLVALLDPIHWFDRTERARPEEHLGQYVNTTGPMILVENCVGADTCELPVIPRAIKSRLLLSISEKRLHTATDPRRVRVSMLKECTPLRAVETISSYKAFRLLNSSPAEIVELPDKSYAVIDFFSDVTSDRAVSDLSRRVSREGKAMVHLQFHKSDDHAGDWESHLANFRALTSSYHEGFKIIHLEPENQSLRVEVNRDAYAFLLLFHSQLNLDPIQFDSNDDVEPWPHGKHWQTY
jgi:hypothetical protein